MKPLVNLYKLGRLPYVKALHFQQVLFDRLKEAVTSTPREGTSIESSLLNLNSPARLRSMNSLLLVEHEPTYTVGIRSKEYDDIYVTRLKNRLEEYQVNADFTRTNRGGLITFHGPGQLVAYPIIYLGDFTKAIKNRSIKAYVEVLENTIIDTLSSIGIQGAHTVREHPGVWLARGERKIAFIGISCKRFVTMHGISINCDCDLSWFEHIVSCGIEDKSVTSIHQELLAKKIIDKQQLRECTSTQINKVQNQSNTLPLNEGAHTTFHVYQPNMEPISNVEHISRAFCKSFSQNFQCSLHEGEQISVKL